MSKILLIVLLFFTCFIIQQKKILAEEINPNINYAEAIRQAELIKNEAENLSKTLHNLTPTVGALSVTTSITGIITGIDETIKKLGELIDSSKKLVENTNTQVTITGETVKTSIQDLTKTMQIELSKLNMQLTELIQSMNSTVQSTNTTIQSVNTTIQHIDTAATKTIVFINSLGGRISSSYYLGQGGLDSSADIVLYKGYRKNTDPQYSYVRFTVDGIDNSEKRQFSATIGTVHGKYSLGAGYIQDGLGLDLGLNTFGINGFDSRISLYRFPSLGLNTELGYRLSFLKGSRLFIFGEDLLKDQRTGGGGISYEKSF